MATATRSDRISYVACADGLEVRDIGWTQQPWRRGRSTMRSQRRTPSCRVVRAFRAATAWSGQSGSSRGCAIHTAYARLVYVPDVPLARVAFGVVQAVEGCRLVPGAAGRDVQSAVARFGESEAVQQLGGAQQCLVPLVRGRRPEGSGFSERLQQTDDGEGLPRERVSRGSGSAALYGSAVMGRPCGKRRPAWSSRGDGWLMAGCPGLLATVQGTPTSAVRGGGAVPRSECRGC